jgi:folate-binding Fe-S cluster repair protein YgfZ
MPVQYTSIVDEHQTTRSSAGVFDISHMGRLRFRGPDALPFLERLLTRRVTDLRPSGIRYSLVTNHQGGILDDVLIYCLPDGVTYFLVVNASNRQKIVHWLSSQRRADEDVDWDDETVDSAMIAVQGPKALSIVEALWNGKSLPSRLRYYSAAEGQVAGREVLLSRTGYTGEDGCEIITPAADAMHIWQQVLQQGAAHGAKPAGLGARDTLRLEAGMPLYGHELNEQIVKTGRHGNGAIRYLGCQTDLGWLRSLHGALRAGERETVRRLAHKLAGSFALYGFNPWRTVIWMFVFVLSFSAIWSLASTGCERTDCKDETVFVMALKGNFGQDDARSEANYPAFAPLAYSFDVFMPFVDFGFKGHWRPKLSYKPIAELPAPSLPWREKETVTVTLGSLLYGLYVFEMILGLVLTSLAVTGFTGMLNTEEDPR